MLTSRCLGLVYLSLGNKNNIEIDQFSSGWPSLRKGKAKENDSKQYLLYQHVLCIIKKYSLFCCLSNNCISSIKVAT